MIELLIVIVLIAIFIAFVIVAINPVEQLRKSRDAARRVYAAELLKAIERYQVTRGENPNIGPTKAYLTCSEIINGDPIADLSGLRDEISSWFPDRINQSESRLYVGLLERLGLSKICYQVESVAYITKAIQTGCFVSSKFFLCVPE